MTQDEQLSKTLQQVANIAQELGKIDVFIDLFNKKINDLEQRITQFSTNLDNYSKQLDRLETLIDQIQAKGEERTRLFDAIDTLNNTLQKLDSKAFEQSMKTIGEDVKILNGNLKRFKTKK